MHAVCAHTLADTHTACTIAITATVLPAFCIVCVLSNMYKRELKRQAQLSAFITPQLHTHTRTHTHSSTSDVSRLVGVMPRCCTVTPSFPQSPLPFSTSPLSPTSRTHWERSGLWSYVLLHHSLTYCKPLLSTSSKLLSQQKAQSAALCELLLLFSPFFAHISQINMFLQYFLAPPNGAGCGAVSVHTEPWGGVKFRLECSHFQASAMLDAN